MGVVNESWHFNANVLQKLSKQIQLVGDAVAELSLNIRYPDGTPASNLEIDNLLDENWNNSYTDINGNVTGYVRSGIQTITCKSPYIDIENYSKQYTIHAGQIYNDYWTLNAVSEVLFTESTTIIFSPAILSKSVNITAMGGGGGGFYGYYYSTTSSGVGGGGGGSGYCAEGTAQPESNIEYDVIVGSGGNGGIYSSTTAPTNGTASSLLGIVGNGGGAARYYNGGTGGTNGTNGVNGIYTNCADGGSGGGTGGGKGGGGTYISTNLSYLDPENGQANTGGGGGGGAAWVNFKYANGANGGSGYVKIIIS